ncbi:hypothetical protein ABPG75_011512 [Micractinium tetrahymenae]
MKSCSTLAVCSRTTTGRRCCGRAQAACSGAGWAQLAGADHRQRQAAPARHQRAHGPAGHGPVSRDRCPLLGPALAALGRPRHLQELRLAGDCAHLPWANASKAGAVLPALRELCLDCREAPAWAYGGWQHGEVGEVSSCLRTALAPATRLTRLELMAVWDQDAAALLRSLPALRELSLHLYQCTDQLARNAVVALEGLPGLTALALGIHAHSGTDEPEGLYRSVLTDMDDWPHWVYLPSLTGVAVTALRLAGAVSLPRDWHQLGSLRYLAVEHKGWWAEETEDINGRLWDGFTWGAASLTALTALTTMELSFEGVYPDANVLATAPRLAEVLVAETTDDEDEWEAVQEWSDKLLRLRPNLHLVYE